MQNLQNYLEVNGKIIVFLNKDGVYYIAIKPICQALNVDYIEQYKDSKSDPILGAELCKHTMQVPGDQSRSMICLPERYIYGWLFAIKSKSPELLEYKRKCYDILYNHFHGTLTKRKELLLERNKIDNRLTQLTDTLSTMPEFNELNNLKGKVMRMGKDLKELDAQLLQGQLSFTFN